MDCANIWVSCASPGKDRIRLGSTERAYILVINSGIVLERSFSAKMKSLGIVSAAICPMYPFPIQLYMTPDRLDCDLLWRVVSTFPTNFRCTSAGKYPSLETGLIQPKRITLITRVYLLSNS
jgi:hypothetical protein